MTTLSLQRPRPMQSWLYGNRELAVAVLAFVSIAIIVTPALCLVLTSFKTNENIFVYPPQIVPSPFTLQNYIDVLNQGQFPRDLLHHRRPVIESRGIEHPDGGIPGVALSPELGPGPRRGDQPHRRAAGPGDIGGGVGRPDHEVERQG